MSNNNSLPNQNEIKQCSAQGAVPHDNSDTPTLTTDPQVITAHSEIQRVAQAINYDNIPQEMQVLPQWCLAESMNDKRPRKTNGHFASPTDRSTWTDFQTARAIAETKGWLIGFVLTADDPFACVDMDVKDCNSIDKATGQTHIEPQWSTPDDLGHYTNFINACSTYTEISASGKGAHAWFRAGVGRGRRDERWEVYDRERFIICTGNTVKNVLWGIDNGSITISDIEEGAHPVEVRQNMIDNVLSEIGKDGSGELTELEEIEPTKTDEEVMLIACNASNAEKFNRLYSGDLTDHNGDNSAADHALITLLCFYSESNEQVRRMFLASELGKRDKVVKRGPEYINRSIRRARSDLKHEKTSKDRELTVFAQSMEPVIDSWIAKLQTETKDKAITQDALTAPISQGMVNTDKPEEVDIEYLSNPYIPKGRAIGIYGRGESGKSSLVSTLCAQNSDKYSTLWITSEEPEAQIKIRHQRSGGHVNTIGVVDGSGFNIYMHLAEAIKEAKSKLTTTLGFVVLDAVVTLVVWGKGENANDDAGVKRLVRFIDYTAQSEGVSILMVGHLKKGNDHGHIADAVLGAAAWTNSVRLAYMLRKLPDEDYAGLMRTAKTSLISPMGQFYKTEPVYQMTANIDGYTPSLCKVVFTSERIYGERELALAMGEDNEQTARIRERDQRITTTVQAIMKMLEGGAQITRTDIHKQLGNPVSKRDWTNVEPALIAKQVTITNGAANRKHYQLMRLVR